MPNVISTAKRNLITPVFGGCTPIPFNKDGWINATTIAEQYGKRLDNWLVNHETQEYMDALARTFNPWDQRDLESPQDLLIVTKRGRHGGGTWLHPKLAIPFARWLCPELAVWMDGQLLSILSGEWERQRRLATTYHKDMCEELAITRQEMGGKDTEAYHYSNESRMLNKVLTQGAASKVDRQSLTVEGIEALERLERKNGFMISRGWSYQTRKEMLQSLFSKEFPQLVDGYIKLQKQQGEAA